MVSEADGQCGIFAADVIVDVLLDDPNGVPFPDVLPVGHPFSRNLFVGDGTCKVFCFKGLAVNQDVVHAGIGTHHVSYKDVLGVEANCQVRFLVFVADLCDSRVLLRQA